MVNISGLDKSVYEKIHGDRPQVVTKEVNTASGEPLKSIDQNNQSEISLTKP